MWMSQSILLWSASQITTRELPQLWLWTTLHGTPSDTNRGVCKEQFTTAGFPRGVLVKHHQDLTWVSPGADVPAAAGVELVALGFACTTSIRAFNQWVLLFSPFLITCSGLQEEMELKPRQVCLFAWTDPTKPRKLTWGYSQCFGEHDLLKVSFLRGEGNAEPI